MKTWPKPAGTWLISCCVLATTPGAWAESTPDPWDAAVVQAIRQAPDPSAVVTAFANGIALDRSDPELYEAYVARMVDFGLPELAYHQAQALTTLQPANGLALGVVAYVDARRGRMADAMSAISLAGQFAPENKFVAHTAGGLLAWYDLKADKTTLPENAQAGLGKIRALLAKQIAFTGAYDAACRACQAQAKAEAQPAQAAQGKYAPAPQIPLQGDLIAPMGCAAPAAPPPYYPADSDAYCDQAPDFYDDGGPDWIAPAPVCWWQPWGFWGGWGFYPFVGAGLFGEFGHGGPLGEERQALRAAEFQSAGSLDRGSGAGGFSGRSHGSGGSLGGGSHGGGLGGGGHGGGHR